VNFLTKAEQFCHSLQRLRGLRRRRLCSAALWRYL